MNGACEIDLQVEKDTPQNQDDSRAIPQGDRRSAPEQLPAPGHSWDACASRLSDVHGRKDANWRHAPGDVNRHSE
jgi:hypothetical protein